MSAPVLRGLPLNLFFPTNLVLLERLYRLRGFSGTDVYGVVTERPVSHSIHSKFKVST